MIENLRASLRHSGFRKYAANTSWLIAEKILRLFAGLFVGIWVARYLGPDQYGLLSYAQSLVFLLSAIATFGLDAIVVRELVEDETKRDKLLGTSFGLKLFGAFLVLPLLALLTQLTSNNSATNILIFVVASAAIFQSFNVIDFYYQSKVLSKYVAAANSIALSLSSIARIALVLNEAPLLYFALMSVFDALLLAVGLIYFYTKESLLKLVNWKFDMELARILLKNSWPLIISSIVVSVYMKIDQVMLKELLDAESVGQYAAAVKLSEAWYFVPVVLAGSLFPAILNAKQKNTQLYLGRLQNFYKLMAWLAIAIAIPVSAFGTKIVDLLYGPAYAPAADVLVVHIWAGVFVCIGTANSKWIIAENLQMFSTLNTSLGAISNIVLNLIMIPKYGIFGAAISTLISYSVAAYFSLLIWKKTRVSFINMTRALFFLEAR